MARYEPIKRLVIIGPLYDPVTWVKITYTGEQVAQWDFQKNSPAFVLEVPLRNLLTSICNFVPCDRVVQKAYHSGHRTTHKVGKFKEALAPSSIGVFFKRRGLSAEIVPFFGAGAGTTEATAFLLCFIC